MDTIITDDGQELTLEEVCALLLVCRSYVSSVKQLYPEAHADIMKGFVEAGENRPDIKDAEELFASTMRA